MLLRDPGKNANRCGEMRIVCPNCQTLYDVPDRLIGSGTRRLRCGECGHGWRFVPEDPPRDTPQDVPQVASVTPVQPPPHDDNFPNPPVDEALGRRFGQSSDDEAKAEIQAAIRDEAQTHPHQDTMCSPPEPLSTTEADRFADIVRAARNHEREMEPERGLPDRSLRAGSRLAVPLLVLLILVLLLLDRHAVMRVFPASAKLFHALHLS